MPELTAQEIFMPEGQCARCGEAPPAGVFLLCELSGEKSKLGFCSPECKTAFVQGMNALIRGVL